ncbi:M56 family metallopeptidase [Undibacterium sp. Di27W]|uniref:M56 family metallopeptidase n=1 Tax=Undibacterium sp. Di27W TaxID=3413036 RepID=UPI003BF25057
MSFIGATKVRARYAASYMALLVCLLVFVREFSLRKTTTHSGIETEGVSTMLPGLVLNQSSWINLSAWLEMHLSTIVLVWLSCVVLLAMRMVGGLFWIGTYANVGHNKSDLRWQMRIDQLSQQFHVRGRVLFRLADKLAGPVTVGIFRPMILLPTAMLSGMPADLLEMLLAHEMAHIKRHDYLLNLIQSAIETLLFYHPAVWWISKQIRNDREEIADELAARVTGEPRRLALALSELANFQFITPQLAQAAHGGNLMSRIKRLVKPEVKSVNWKAALAIVGLTTSCLALYAQANAPIAAADAKRQAIENALVVNERNGDKNPLIDFNKCRPVYPKASLQRAEAGVVYASALVAANGKILKAKVDRSAGFPDLDNAVVDALENCKAKAMPGQVNGKKTDLWAKVQFVWVLE